jgi:hypothetical protein
MEKLFTLSTADFEKYRKENSDQITEAQRNEPETFHYTTMGDFLLRSQLDAYDPRLPGTGMFDLKTRAVLSIRMDAQNYHEGSGYEIRGLRGKFESYEREYYDMIRAAFLKYSLQVRMGRMDGIFVAFHNTERIFGFQYISLPEMDEALHGQSDLALGDAEFKLSLELLNRVLDRATKKFPKQSLRLFFETREATAPFMYIFAEPVTDSEIKEIQESKRAGIEEWERRVLGLDQDSQLEDIQDERKTEWESLQAKVEETMESDELGICESNDDLDGKDALIGLDNLHESSMQESARDRLLEHVVSEDSEDEESPQAINEGDEVEKLSVKETSNSEAAWSEGDKQGILPDHEHADIERGEDMGLTKEKTETHSDIIDACTSASDVMQEHASIPEDEPIPQQDTVGDKIEGSSPSGTESTTKTEFQEGNSPLISKKRLLAMTLTIRNKVNNKYVLRPVQLAPTDEWSIEYAMAEIPGEDRSHNLYKKAQMRRSKFYERTDIDKHFGETLRRISRAGRKWRQKQDEIDQLEPTKVLGDAGINADTGEKSP